MGSDILKILYDIYYNVMLISSVVMLTMSALCFLTKLPKKDIFSMYRVVQYCWGISMFVWANQILFITFSNLRFNNLILATTINLICYYTATQLIGTSTLLLLTPKAKKANNSLIKRRLIWSGIYYAILIISFFLTENKSLRMNLLIIAVVIYVKELVAISMQLLRRYRYVLRMLENYYSEDVHKYIVWIRNGYLGCCVILLFAVFAVFTVQLTLVIFTIIGMTGLFLLFISFQNYKHYLYYIDDVSNIPSAENITEQNIADAEESEEDKKEDKMLDIRLSTKIGEMLQQWVDSKGFTESSITIMELSKEIGTNRTYLTRYINEKYNMTFRVWIASLRIAYSKELMEDDARNDNKMTILDIAMRVGYSTSSHFIKVFSELNNSVSPNKWRGDLK